MSNKEKKSAAPNNQAKRPAKSALIGRVKNACAEIGIGDTAKEWEHYVSKALKKSEPDKPTHMTNILADGDETLPSLRYLLGMYMMARGKGECSGIQHSIGDLQQWLVLWLAAQLERETIDEEDMPKDYLENWSKAADSLRKQCLPVRSQNADLLPTLQNFPADFLPLVIITGTGHAFPPKQIEDLFRDNAKVSDLKHIARFDFRDETDTLLVSDSDVIEMTTDKERARLLGNKNLLVIGGPAVNAVTRQYWKTGVFMFRYSPQRKDFDDLFDKILRSGTRLKNDEGHVSLFFDYLNEDPDKIDIHADRFHGRGPNRKERENIYKLVTELRDRIKNHKATYNHIKDIFNPIGRVDPLAYGGGLPPVSGDYALISLAPNWWEKHLWDGQKNEDQTKPKTTKVAVIVAGFHELGTTLGLKALVNARTVFRKHPLGQFLRVTESHDSRVEKIQRPGTYHWREDDPLHPLLTPTYTIAELKNKIEAQSDVLEGFSKDEVENYLAFLDRFQG